MEPPAAMPRPAPTLKASYPHLVALSTRWSDNDAYGHLNNVIYYSLFDTAVNRHLLDHGVLDIARSPIVGFVVETRCTYFASLAYPDALEVGLKVVQLGNSSVTYEVAIFRASEERAAAVGSFTHVYVDRATNRPARIPDPVRQVLAGLVVAG
jgi:acyl-CoA thioester hydrolase